ncbi:LOW QUALITY PROTEIN: uncharacterized protein LOC108097947 [Drosophila ficusphila]|uniref:LOW QUALITY PROTEIN: uncharacterized protein LOC108097947 n=1 Tax=Drosophila ficusphila TaxID=30025 RepID=UPI0007E7E0CB|nr:LOW QUALITY PROTEIN: uncharacterized protein LOC108097947 [Drosophila ficusphila]
MAELVARLPFQCVSRDKRERNGRRKLSHRNSNNDTTAHRTHTHTHIYIHSHDGIVHIRARERMLSATHTFFAFSVRFCGAARVLSQQQTRNKSSKTVEVYRDASKNLSFDVVPSSL